MTNQEALRNALLNRNFAQAQELTRAWGLDVQHQLEAADDSDDRRRLFEEACAWAEENLHLARVVRAHISTELHANSASFLYRDTDLTQPHWQLEA